jgi:NTP pyrophosphatase (non-canonical NTP hydrolase)
VGASILLQRTARIIIQIIEIARPMDIKKLQQITKQIKGAYADMNRKKGKEVFRAKDYADAFVGDVGDLMKVLVSYSKRPTKDGYKKISHELADCLWSVLAITDELGIDIEKEYLINMEYLKQKFFEKKTSK